eukprot:scpid21148/ scgid18696/ Myosin phosphatase Rho-interacting protein; Rho-interacting protein 3; p116Rip
MSGGACKEFKPNLFKKNTCQTCYKSKDQHGVGGAGGGDGTSALKKRSTSSVGERTVVKDGYLTKAPPDLNAKFGSKQWKKRWFVLTSDATLSYYESEKTYPKKALGDINLHDCSSIRDGDGEAKQFNCLALATASRTYYIKAESKEEIDGWMEALNTQLSTETASEVTRPPPVAARKGSTSSNSSTGSSIEEQKKSLSSTAGSIEDTPRARGSSQIAKLRARSMASEPSRRETLSTSRRRQGTGASSPSTVARGVPVVTDTDSMTSPTSDDWDTLEDVADPSQSKQSVAASESDRPGEVSAERSPSPTTQQNSTGEDNTSSTPLAANAPMSDNTRTQEMAQAHVATPVNSQSQPSSSRDATSQEATIDTALVSKLEQELGEHRQHRQTLEVQVTLLQTDLTSAKAAAQIAQQQCRQQQEEHFEQLDEEKHRCSELQRKSVGLEDKNSELTAQVSALTTSRDELKTTLESSNETSHQEIALLQEQLKSQSDTAQTKVRLFEHFTVHFGPYSQPCIQSNKCELGTFPPVCPFFCSGCSVFFVCVMLCLFVPCIFRQSILTLCLAMVRRAPIFSGRFKHILMSEVCRGAPDDQGTKAADLLLRKIIKFAAEYTYLPVPRKQSVLHRTTNYDKLTLPLVVLCSCHVSALELLRQAPGGAEQCCVVSTLTRYMSKRGDIVAAWKICEKAAAACTCPRTLFWKM